MNSVAYNNLTPAQQDFINAIRTHGPGLGLDISQEKYTRMSMRLIAEAHKGNRRIPDWIARDLARRGSRGIFLIPEVIEMADEEAAPVAEALESVQEMAAAIG